MAFTVRDYRDLLQLLADHPDWREELRRALLSDDFLALPQIVRELAEAQKRSEERLTRLEQTVAELAEAQKRTEQRVEELAEAQKRSEERLTRLEQTVAELAEAQRKSEERLTRLEQTVAELAEAQRKSEERLTRLEQTVAELAEAQRKSEERLTRLEQTVAELAEAQKRTEQQIRELIEIQKQHAERLANVEERLTNVEGRLTNVEENLEKLTKRVDRMDIRLAKVDGRTLELEYERKAGGFFGRIISNPQVVNLGEWQDRLKPALSGEEISDVWLADLILRGSLRKTSQEQPKREAWLVIEISVLVDAEDVERAVRRAELLRKADILALPVVAGEEITDRAIQMAEGNRVIFVKDGSIRFLEQALVRYG